MIPWSTKSQRQLSVLVLCLHIYFFSFCSGSHTVLQTLERLFRFTHSSLLPYSKRIEGVCHHVLFLYILQSFLHILSLILTFSHSEFSHPLWLSHFLCSSCCTSSLTPTSFFSEYQVRICGKCEYLHRDIPLHKFEHIRSSLRKNIPIGIDFFLILWFFSLVFFCSFV